MLMDLLVYKEGPRLRNHLSHGEINFYQVDKETADFVLYVCLSWACLFLNTDFTDTKTNGMMEKLKIHGQDYKSIFHYKVVLKRMLIKLFTTLKKWQGIELPTIDQLICKKNATDDKLNEMLSQVIQQIVNNFTQLSSVDRLLLANHDLSTLEILCENICLSTLFRPKIEQEVTTILQKIVHQSQCISENILQITSLRYEQLSKKELRSRQRKNYSILISSIPTILNALNLVSFIVVTELYMSTNLPDVTLCDQLYLIKFLKQVLQFTENMATNTSIEHNKWSEGLTLVTSFLKKVTNFYEKQKF
ncbi:endoplasmic reticulum membrane-associated RNA degradation protein-like [Antedon mediterranea]|uniref:endoplasmic reticulum membrane-associated RNA degradation protein-like n=1 Tax=Antedon mediterranea TaxID=105859 RepID=UPI003AF6B722